jgi:hypothetical protein
MVGLASRGDAMERVLCGWSLRFGGEIVTQLKSRAAELAHLPLSERIPALLDSLSMACENADEELYV